MADSSPDLKEVNDALEKLGAATEKAAEKHNVSTRFQVFIALLGVLIAGISAFNARNISQVQANQDELKARFTEQQTEISIGTSVLHESMLILDTKDEPTRTTKVKAQVSFVLALMQRYIDEPSDETAFMKRFYLELLTTLSSALSKPDTQELTDYIRSQTAELAGGVAGATTGAAGAAKNGGTANGAVRPASASPTFPNGEATQAGVATGWAYDVFWCVYAMQYPQTNDSEALAEVVYKGLVQRQAAEKLGRIRLRRLPEIVNQTANYQIPAGGVTIRSNSQKSAEAASLANWIEQDLHAAQRPEDVAIQSSGQKLPRYLSAFACLQD